VLFDIDGTLSAARASATPEMKTLLHELRQRVFTGVVGGSDLVKQQEQLGHDALHQFDYNFPENGIVAYREGKQFHSSSLVAYLGEERFKKLVSFILRYVADLDIPVKRGTFVELRTGLMNVSPIGRNCSMQERAEYEKFDLAHGVRARFVQALQREFADYKLRFSVGGQISFDVFPVGWDKTYCLQHVEKEAWDEIHFFGDKTKEGQNDYEIYNDPRVRGHHVDSPADTARIVRELFF
jgi:phosphomannomutase